MKPGFYEVRLPVHVAYSSCQNSDGYHIRQDMWDWLLATCGPKVVDEQDFAPNKTQVGNNPRILKHLELWDFYVAAIGGNPAYAAVPRYHFFQFKDPNHAMLFKLTWTGR